MSGISLKPSDAVAGGGLIDDVDVTIESCRAALWDYNGQIPSPVVALAVTMIGAEGAKAIQYYSAGDPKHFVPSQDGRKFVPVGSATGLNENTNAMMFLVSLVNAGFPEDKIGDDLGVFDGTMAHVNRVPQPARPGLGGGVTGKVGKPTVLVVSKIHKLPWENAANLAKGQAKTKTAKTASAPVAVAEQASGPAANGQGDLTGKATEGLLAILAEKGGSITKAQIAQAAFKYFQKDADRNQLVQMVYKDEFLGGEGTPWSFDGTTVTMG